MRKLRKYKNIIRNFKFSSNTLRKSSKTIETEKNLNINISKVLKKSKQNDFQRIQEHKEDIANRKKYRKQKNQVILDEHGKPKANFECFLEQISQKSTIILEYCSNIESSTRNLYGEFSVGLSIF